MHRPPDGLHQQMYSESLEVAALLLGAAASQVEWDLNRLCVPEDGRS